MRIAKLALVVFLFPFFLENCFVEKKQSVKENYATTLEKYLAINSKMLLPNTQSRPDEFDINSYLDSLEKAGEELGLEFYSKEGIEFLQTYLKTTTNELDIVGILIILHHSNRTDARQIIKKYQTYTSSDFNNNEVISSIAQELYEDSLSVFRN